MWENALNVAGHITNPMSIAVFTVVIAGILIFYLPKRLPRYRIVAVILACGIVLLGLAPVVLSTVAQIQGVYHLRIVILNPNNIPIDDAKVTLSIGGEAKRILGGWEFDIPPQTTPRDGKIEVFATVPDAFLSGSASFVLGRDYYPTMTIKLAHDSSATIRGVVLDRKHSSVQGATVSITGYSDSVTTDTTGNFSLPAHAAEGQVVLVRAQKGALQGTLNVVAGKGSVELVIQ